MIDTHLGRPVPKERQAREHDRKWVVVTLTSLMAAPVMVYLTALSIAAVAYDWTIDSPDDAQLLNMVLAGAFGGLVVGLVARLKGPAMWLPILLGGLVGYGFDLMVWQNTALSWSNEARILLIYAPIQAAVYFLSAWSVSHE